MTFLGWLHQVPETKDETVSLFTLALARVVEKQNRSRRLDHFTSQSPPTYSDDRNFEYGIVRRLSTAFSSADVLPRPTCSYESLLLTVSGAALISPCSRISTPANTRHKQGVGLYTFAVSVCCNGHDFERLHLRRPRSPGGRPAFFLPGNSSRRSCAFMGQGIRIGRNHVGRWKYQGGGAGAPLQRPRWVLCPEQTLR